MGEAGLAGSIDILNSDVTDGVPSGGANMYYKARIFSFADVLLVKLSTYIF